VRGVATSWLKKKIPSDGEMNNVYLHHNSDIYHTHCIVGVGKKSWFCGFLYLKSGLAIINLTQKLPGIH